MERQLFRVANYTGISENRYLHRKEIFCFVVCPENIKQMRCLSDRFQRHELSLFFVVSFDDALSDFSYEIFHFCSLP